MIRPLFVIAFSAMALVAAQPAVGQLNLYCSSPNTAWCQGMAIGFERATGVKVAVVQKATGEMLAQVKAERANPRGDIWWVGPADAYLQAAEEGLLEAYQSPNLSQLHDWARRVSEASQNRASGVYGGILSPRASSRSSRAIPSSPDSWATRIACAARSRAATRRRPTCSLAR